MDGFLGRNAFPVMSPNSGLLGMEMRLQVHTQKAGVTEPDCSPSELQHQEGFPGPKESSRRCRRHPSDPEGVWPEQPSPAHVIPAALEAVSRYSCSKPTSHRIRVSQSITNVF